MDKGKLFEFTFGCRAEVIEENVILTPFIPLRKFLTGDEKADTFKGKIYSGVNATKDGRKYSIINCGIGEGLAGDAVILLGQTKVKRILFTGSCGGVGKVSINDLLICEGALSGEGFSRYYREDFKLKDVLKDESLVLADEVLTTRLTESLNKEKKAKRGKVFTTGSLVAETSEFLEEIEKEGFLGIDMELSAVYTAAKKVGIPVCSLLYVSDLPLEEPMWKENTQEEIEKKKKCLEKVISHSVDFIIGGE